LDNKRAFTIIELIVSMGIMMLIVVAASTMTSRWYLQNNVEATKNMLVSSIQKAQNYAMSKNDDLTWGVCLSGNTIRLFGGSCALPTIKDDYEVPDSVTISGLSTVTFSNFRGEPDSAQSITMSGNNKTYTLTINMAGGMSVN
jgi:type II secretory pathway pseudopilin PulG